MSVNQFKLEKLDFVELQTLLEHTSWNIDSAKTEKEKEKFIKVKYEIIDELQKFYDIDDLSITEDINGVKHACEDEIKQYYVWSRDLFTNEIVKLIDISTDRKYCDYILERKSLKELIDENGINTEINYFRKDEVKELFDSVNNQIKLKR